MKETFETFYILWNPVSQLPPTVQFDSLEEARQAATVMALRHREQFYVMKSEMLFETETQLKVLTPRNPPKEPEPAKKAQQVKNARRKRKSVK